jgi:putative transposase
MRKPRELEEGARYHVTARANRKEMILDGFAMKELFLSIVRRAKKKYDFRIENFCIMGNHFHFVIRPGRGASLSAIMQWILSVFAMTFNRIKGLTGHVWGCRFFSRIIASVLALVLAFDYIDGNPVRAGQVLDRREWRWGGLWHDLSGRCDIVDDMDEWLKALFPERRLPVLK